MCLELKNTTFQSIESKILYFITPLFILDKLFHYFQPFKLKDLTFDKENYELKTKIMESMRYKCGYNQP